MFEPILPSCPSSRATACRSIRVRRGRLWRSAAHHRADGLAPVLGELADGDGFLRADPHGDDGGALTFFAAAAWCIKPPCCSRMILQVALTEGLQPCDRRRARGKGEGVPRGNSLWRGPWLRKPGRWASTRESEVSLRLGIPGRARRPPWSWVRGMKSPRSGPRAEGPGRGMQRGRKLRPCQDERGRRSSGAARCYTRTSCASRSNGGCCYKPAVRRLRAKLSLRNITELPLCGFPEKTAAMGEQQIVKKRCWAERGFFVILMHSALATEGRGTGFGFQSMAEGGKVNGRHRRLTSTKKGVNQTVARSNKLYPQIPALW